MFKPGQSGNPGGRPRDSGLKYLCRLHTAEAIKTAVSVMQNKKAPAQARLTAAFGLLDRGYGKPLQMMEHSGKDGTPLFDPSNTLEVARTLAFMLEMGAHQVSPEETAH